MPKASNQKAEPAAPVTDQVKPAAKKQTKCRALDIGHRACKCGGEYCQQPDAE